ncbi:MAG: amidohydrolase family protein [Alphaproteobacteria bacterium]|nr:amidohydrolase family protein [Alphaproteobacteria bacterium]
MPLKKSAILPPPRSPVHFGPVSNGEYAPRPAHPRHQEAEALVLRLAGERARALGMSRRQVLAGPIGTALALHVVNLLSGCRGGKHDSGYAVDSVLGCDADGARALLSGPDFVFDVQVHHVDASEGAGWVAGPWKTFFDYMTFTQGCVAGDYSCIGQEALVHEVFVNSDTTIAVLSALPAGDGLNPLPDAMIDETRQLINALAASERLLTHAILRPNLGEAELDTMGATLEQLDPVAWKVYTPWSPDGGAGWWLDDDVGGAFLERVMQAGPRRVCCHKGLPLTGQSREHASPRDVGPAAAAFPDIDFLVYHSGYDTAYTEGPYDPEGQGADRLIRSLQDAGIGPGQNVYAELGATWHNVMASPDEAAHLLGKLLKHLGEDNVLWGTDCVWFGTPQPQIDAFRAFTISEEMQETHGYPALTDAVKAKILGLNAARVYGVDPDAARCTLAEDLLAARRDRARDWGHLGPPVYGPRTRRELLGVLKG